VGSSVKACDAGMSRCDLGDWPAIRGSGVLSECETEVGAVGSGGVQLSRDSVTGSVIKEAWPSVGSLSRASVRRS
jgi:hypothetical protein